MARTHSMVSNVTMVNRAWIKADELGVPLPLQDEVVVRRCEPPQPTPTPTRTATPTPTPTPTPTLTPTQTLTPTPTPTGTGQPVIDIYDVYLPLLRKHHP